MLENGLPREAQVYPPELVRALADGVEEAVWMAARGMSLSPEDVDRMTRRTTAAIPATLPPILAGDISKDVDRDGRGGRGRGLGRHGG